MNEASPAPRSVFTPEQLALLNANTIEAIRNGLAERYAAQRRNIADVYTDLAMFHRDRGGDDLIAKNLDVEAKASPLSGGAELPFVFTSLNKFNQGVNDAMKVLGIARVFPDSGMILPYSPVPRFTDYDITVMEPGFVGEDFLKEDASFAAMCLRKQLEAGMVFHHRDGFIPVQPTV